MALTIEDGTGVGGADSFVTLVEFASIQADLWGAELDSTDPLREAALRRAYLFMKSLEWCNDADYPTFGGTVPDDVKKAQVIFGRSEVENPGALSPNVVPGQQKILTRVGEIGWTPTGQSGVDAQRTEVTMAMDLLKDLLCGSGSTKFLTRA